MSLTWSLRAASNSRACATSGSSAIQASSHHCRDTASHTRSWLCPHPVDGDRCVTNADGVAEISEQALIAEVQARLTATYAHFPADDVTAVVQSAYARFDQSPIRDFV